MSGLIQTMKQRFSFGSSKVAQQERARASRAQTTLTATRRVPAAVACELSDLLEASKHRNPRSSGFRALAARSQQAGQHRSRFIGRGMDFDEVRRYQPGDDIRHIDWRVTARTGYTYTKRFREERERPVYIVLAQTRSMFFGSRHLFKSVFAARLAASLAWQTYHQQDRLGGIIYNNQQMQDYKPRSSQHGLHYFLKGVSGFNQALLDPSHANKIDDHRAYNQNSVNNDQRSNNTQRRYKPSTDSQLEQAMQHLTHVVKPGSTIFILSDFHDINPNTANEGLKTALNRLARHNQLCAAYIYDQYETALPQVGWLGIGDGEQRLQINTNDPKLTEHHHARFDQHEQGIKGLLQPMGVHYVSLATDHNLDQLDTGLW